MDVDEEEMDDDTASENLSECARTQRRERRELQERETENEGPACASPILPDDGDDLQYEEVEEKAATTVAASVEQCVDLVRNAWSNRHESEGVLRGERWANRQRLGHPCAPLGLEVSGRDSVARGPEEILRQRHVVDNTWTHLVLHPQHCRSQVLAAEDARDLYTSLSVESYRDAGMGIMAGRSGRAAGPPGAGTRPLRGDPALGRGGVRGDRAVGGDRRAPTPGQHPAGRRTTDLRRAAQGSPRDRAWTPWPHASGTTTP